MIGQAGGGPAAPSTYPPATLPARTMPADDGARSSGISRNAEEPPEGGTTNATRRATPEQLISEAMAQPAQGTLAGQPLSLVSAIAAARDRPRQLEAVHAYWRLLQAIGDHHYLLERQQRLARLTATKDESGDLRTAQAVAMARLHEAEIHVTSAQHELAASLRLVATAALPWPADRPLTEAYRTRLKEMFAGAKVPDRARLLDQTLPLRQQAVETHAAAVLAAEESLDAALELFTGQAGVTGRAGGVSLRDQGSLARVLHAMDAQVQQQQAFVAAVCRYNHDIADYALMVVPAQTSPATLVTTLIKQPQPMGGPLTVNPTVPASYQEPATALVVPPSGGRVAPPPVASPLPSDRGVVRDRALAEPQLIPPTVPEQSTPPPANLPRDDRKAPPLGPPQESTIPQPAEAPASEKKTSDTRRSRSVFEPVAENVPAEGPVQLVAKLYDDHNLPLPAGRPISLAACLRSATPDHRLETIDAYWTARQAAAQCQLFAEKVRWLDALKPALAAENPPSPTGMLDLRSARAAVASKFIDSQADCIATEFQLAAASSLPTTADLPRATSLPFAGHFPLPLSLRERAGVRAESANSSWPQRQLDAEISGWEQAIRDHATTVAEADATRAAVTNDLLAGQAGVERVLAIIDLQADESAAFLQAVGEYNRVIARNVRANVAPDTSAEEIVRALNVPQ